MSDDHEAIRNLLGRYCELMDAGDFDGLGGLFANASLADEHGHAFAHGRDEVAAQWHARTLTYDGSPRTRHVTSNTVIDVDEDTATARSAYIVFQATEAMPLQAIIAGRYSDTFTRDINGWQFSERRYAVDLVGDVSHHLAPPAG